MRTQSEIEAMIPDVMAQYPTLGQYGFNRKADPYPYRKGMPKQIVVGFPYGDPGQFCIPSVVKAMAWIDETGLLPTTRAFVWKSSYGLKHEYEYWHRETHGESDYLANGDFIAAAILSGMRIKQVRKGGPNAFVAASRKALRAIRIIIYPELRRTKRMRYVEGG